MRYEYCEKDIGEMEDRLHATEARAEAMERFCPPTSKVEAVTADRLYQTELLTAVATLLEELARRDTGDDEQAKRLAALCREQSAGYAWHCQFPPVKFVRGG